MASSDGGGNEEEDQQQLAMLGKTLKEGERILAPTRRPDGTMRRPIRIRAGYTPQDEVAIYQSKGALWRKEMEAALEVPPGYDPVLDAKPKTKSAKRNERKKEKKLQAALDKEKNFEAKSDGEMNTGEMISANDVVQGSKAVDSVAHQMNMLIVSPTSVDVPSQDSIESSSPGGPGPDIDKRIRALKKKIRQTEAQQQKTEQESMMPEQLEKVAKLESWRMELKLLEDKRAELSAS